MSADLDDTRAEAARRHRLPPAITERLVGDTEAEIEADAARLAEAIAPTEPEPEHVALARRAIAAAENNPNRPILELLGRKAEANRAFVESLHPSSKEPE